MNENIKKALKKLAIVTVFGLVVLFIGTVAAAYTSIPTCNFPGFGDQLVTVIMGCAILYYIKK